MVYRLGLLPGIFIRLAVNLDWPIGKATFKCRWRRVGGPHEWCNQQYQNKRTKPDQDAIHW